jgi:bifunctional DNA-binding transcriptional regulator/antitoxin component of YhaV-PrlF toxin-antitoxin module
MATRRKSKRNLRKLTAMGKYTRYVTIPKGLLRELRWRRGQKLVVTRSGDKLIIEDWKPKSQKFDAP